MNDRYHVGPLSFPYKVPEALKYVQSISVDGHIQFDTYQEALNIFDKDRVTEKDPTRKPSFRQVMFFLNQLLLRLHPDKNPPELKTDATCVTTFINFVKEVATKANEVDWEDFRESHHIGHKGGPDWNKIEDERRKVFRLMRLAVGEGTVEEARLRLQQEYSTLVRDVAHLSKSVRRLKHLIESPTMAYIWYRYPWVIRG